MWVSINGEDVSSLSHSEVVRILKEIPLGTRVNLELVSPKRKSRGKAQATVLAPLRSLTHAPPGGLQCKSHTFRETQLLTNYRK